VAVKERPALDELRPEHVAALARFAIPAEMIEAAGVRSVTDAETRELFGVRGHYGTDLSGFCSRVSIR